MPGERSSIPINYLRVFSTLNAPMTVESCIDYYFWLDLIRMKDKDHRCTVDITLTELGNLPIDAMVAFIQKIDGKIKPELLTEVFRSSLDSDDDSVM